MKPLPGETRRRPSLPAFHKVLQRGLKAFNQGQNVASVRCKASGPRRRILTLWSNLQFCSLRRKSAFGSRLDKGPGELSAPTIAALFILLITVKKRSAPAYLNHRPNALFPSYFCSNWLLGSKASSGLNTSTSTLGFQETRRTRGCGLAETPIRVSVAALLEHTHKSASQCYSLLRRPQRPIIRPVHA